MFIGVFHWEEDSGDAVFTGDIGGIVWIIGAWVINRLHIGKSGPIKSGTLMTNEVDFSKIFKQQLDLLGLVVGYEF